MESIPTDFERFLARVWHSLWSFLFNHGNITWLLLIIVSVVLLSVFDIKVLHLSAARRHC